MKKSLVIFYFAVVIACGLAGLQASNVTAWWKTRQEQAQLARVEGHWAQCYATRDAENLSNEAEGHRGQIWARFQFCLHQVSYP